MKKLFIKSFLFAALIAISASSLGQEWFFSGNPSSGSVNEDNALVLGMRFTVSETVSATQIRFWNPNGTGTHTAYIYDAGSTPIFSTPFGSNSTGWQTVSFAGVVLVPGTQYTVAVSFNNGSTTQYYATDSYFASPITGGLVETPVNAGVYTYSTPPAKPTSSFASSNYWVDIFVTPVGGGNTPPSATAGLDQTIYLPTTSTTLSGSGGDPDEGDVLSYSWSRISGPNIPLIVSPTSASTSVTGMAQGTHVFRLTVTDNFGATGTDDVSVFVLPSGSAGSISTTIIPLSAPMIMRHNAGIEDWNLQNTVAVPTAESPQLPRTSYFRWNWYEIEDAQNVFDWTLFDQPIRAAIDNGQTFSFSVMTYNPDCGNSWYSGKPRPTASSGPQSGCMTYPLYLHNAMQAEAPNTDWLQLAWDNTDPTPDVWVWVPNYNSPTYLARVRALYDSIYNHLNTTTYNGVLLKNVVEYVDNRSFGSWGEAHHFPYIQDRANWPSGRQPTVAALDSIMAAPVRAFPDIWTIAPFSILDSYRLWNTWTDPAVAKFVLQLRNASGMAVGFRRDHMAVTDFGYTFDYDYTNLNDRGYTNLTGVDYPMPGSTWTGVPNTVTGPYGIDTAMMENLWRRAPRVGEPFGLWVAGETRGEGANLPKEVRFWHYNSFGNGNWGLSYNNPSPFGFNYDSVRLAAKIAGHRLQINGGLLTRMTRDSAFTIQIDWQNVGLTPVYERYNTRIQLRNTLGTVVWSGTSQFDPFLFSPQSSATPVSDNFVLSGVSPGTYNLFVRLEDARGYRIPLPLAIEGRGGDGAYLLASNVTVFEQGEGGGGPPANVPPAANAGPNQSVTLPTSVATLSGSGTDTDGTIASYTWTFVSGPGGSTITSPLSASTSVTGLVQGVYIFRLTVSDDDGATSFDDVQVTVNASPTTPPPSGTRKRWKINGRTIKLR